MVLWASKLVTASGLEALTGITVCNHSCLIKMMYMYTIGSMAGTMCNRPYRLKFQDYDPWRLTSLLNLRIRAARWRECIYVLQIFFWFFVVRTTKCINMKQPFSGTAARIFMTLLPNDSGENGVSNAIPKWGLAPPPRIIFLGTKTEKSRKIAILNSRSWTLTVRRMR